MDIFAGKPVSSEFVLLPQTTLEFSMNDSVHRPSTMVSTSDMHSAGQYSNVITVLAAIDKDVDVMAQMQDAFHNFIESGQVWALLIGIVLGYIFRSFTSY